jgi:uncharacterized protein YgiM (DUF1202 family)
MQSNHPVRKTSHVVSALAGVVLFGLVAVPASAEERVAKRSDVVIREGKGSIYKPVATLRRGDSVNVVGKDDANPRWLKVEVNGKAGWVYEDALESRSAMAARGPRSGFANSGASAGAEGLAASSVGIDGDGREFTLAGAGWDARRYAQQKNLNTTGLQAVTNARQALSGQELEAFQSQGKVGGAGGR